MTREELDSTFTQYHKPLISMAMKRKLSKEDAEDVVMQAYVVACDRTEYHNVPTRYIRSWWYYQVRDELRSLKGKQKREEEALTGLSEDPTCAREGHRELSPVEVMQLLEEQWDSYNPYKQTRLRQQWERDGIPLLNFMERKDHVAK